MIEVKKSLWRSIQP